MRVKVVDHIGVAMRPPSVRQMRMVSPEIEVFVGDRRRVGGGPENKTKRRTQRWREVGVGAQILRHLGVRSIALLAAREQHYVGLAGFGIEIAQTIRIEE